MLATTHELIKRVAKQIGLNETQVEAILQPEAVHEFEVKLGEKSYKAYRSQHNNKLGPYKGGLRFHPKVTRDEAVALSTLMSLKTAAIGLPLGGGKGGIAIDPKTLTPAEMESISRQFVQKLHAHIGPDKDIPAPDVNTNAQVIDWMVDEFHTITGDTSKASFTGKSVSNGGSLGREAATGRGGAVALAEYLQLSGQTNKPLKIAIQGFGNVGAFFAEVAKATQPNWQIVAVSDSRATISSRDLPIDELIAWKGQGKSFQDFLGAPVGPPEELIGSEVDILVLAALDNAVTDTNMREVQAKIILELANGPVDTIAENYLTSQNVIIIPDIIANAGGVIVSYLEWLQNRADEQWSEEHVNQKLEDYIRTAMSTIYSMSKSDNMTLKEVSIAHALKQLA